MKNEKITICIAGVTGWVGRNIVKYISESSEYQLVSAVARNSSGLEVGELLGIKDLHAMIFKDVKDALRSKPDVLIDYTSPLIVKSNVMEALKRGVNVVIGTSGLSDEDFQEIEEEAVKNSAGVVAAGNYSIASALMLNFSVVASRYMKSWEIIDYASERKTDVPSGTTFELVHRISRESRPKIEVPDNLVTGIKETRGAELNGMKVHSLRLPGFTIGAEVIFGDLDQTLSIRYNGGNDATPYVYGTMIAIKKAMNTKGLIRGMDKIMGFEVPS